MFEKKGLLPSTLAPCLMDIGQVLDLMARSTPSTLGEAYTNRSVTDLINIFSTISNALSEAQAAERHALAPNTLAPNTLVPNTLAPNTLAPNTLAPNTFTPGIPINTENTTYSYRPATAPPPMRQEPTLVSAPPGICQYTVIHAAINKRDSRASSIEVCGIFSCMRNANGCVIRTANEQYSHADGVHDKTERRIHANGCFHFLYETEEWTSQVYSEKTDVMSRVYKGTSLRVEEESIWTVWAPPHEVVPGYVQGPRKKGMGWWEYFRTGLLM
jgi:hypothetical protein